MDVWLLQTGEPLPSPITVSRLWRTGLVARELVRRGHTVTWWATDWSHSHKRRYAHRGRVRLDLGCECVLLPAPGYTSDLSIQRLLDHYVVARRLGRAMRDAAPPDLILASYPTIEVAAVAVAFGRRNGVPVVVDVRDRWPDVFWQMSARRLRPLVRVGAAPYLLLSRYVFRWADGIIGNGVGAVSWAKRRGARRSVGFEAVIPMAYDQTIHDPDAHGAGLRYWSSLGIERDDRCLTLVYLGVLNERTRDLGTILSAAKIAQQHGRFRIIICGVGEDADKLRAQLEPSVPVFMPGWIDGGRLTALLEIADVGLNPTRPFKNFSEATTNKPVEYLSAGLPIITTVQSGELWSRLQSAECGLGYAEGDATSLAKAVMFLMDDPSRLARMQAAARELFKRYYEASHVYGDLVKQLEQFVRSDGKPNAR